MPESENTGGTPEKELFVGNSWKAKSPSASENTPRPEELFDWSSWQTKLPPLANHSQAKLSVLRAYIEDYIQILCTGNPGQDRFRLTLVDGFAGGGIYEGGMFGSPFVLMQAVQVAEARLNETRTKRINIDCHFYLVEKAAPAADCLEHQIKQSIYKHDFGRSIFLIRETFEKAQERIIVESQRRFSRGGSRVIFFLDQCGYTDAPPPLLRSISEKLNWRAEFIVNLAIDWLTAYARSEATFRKIFPGLGVEHVLPVEKVVEAIANPKFDPQYIVESLVGPAFQKVSGSPFFSPFYIQAPKSNRGYWLVHLAPARRARSAMLDVYWRVANGCRHFGHTGLDMLMFKPEADPSGFLNGFEFSESTRASVLKRLIEDFAREIRDKHAKGISYREFHDSYCNRVMANEAIVREALITLMQAGEIEVHGQKGGNKLVDTINPDDVITPGQSPMLIPLVRPPKKRLR
jgi:three-Cys-motif partner protein